MALSRHATTVRAGISIAAALGLGALAAPWWDVRVRAHSAGDDEAQKTTTVTSTAQTTASKAVPPSIRDTIPSATATELLIDGSGFCTAPSVTLGGMPLTLVSAAPTLLVVALPTSFDPGTYVLVVSCGSTGSASFTSTLGAVGPRGDKGDK